MMMMMMLSAQLMLQSRSIYSTCVATAFHCSAVLLDKYKHQTDKKNTQKLTAKNLINSATNEEVNYYVSSVKWIVRIGGG